MDILLDNLRLLLRDGTAFYRCTHLGDMPATMMTWAEGLESPRASSSLLVWNAKKIYPRIVAFVRGDHWVVLPIWTVYVVDGLSVIVVSSEGVKMSSFRTRALSYKSDPWTWDKEYSFAVAWELLRFLRGFFCPWQGPTFGRVGLVRVIAQFTNDWVGQQYVLRNLNLNQEGHPGLRGFYGICE